MCDAANRVVQGKSDEDKLIAAAKAVAAHTAELLLTCQVKADPRSENNRRLQVRLDTHWPSALSRHFLLVILLFFHL